MTPTFLTGLLGSIILVCGAAYPDHPTSHPTHSLKNWLLAVGGFLMLVYSWLGWREGGLIFFLILELFINLSSILMMADTPDRFDASVLSLGALVFIGWSLSLFEGYQTVIFILGLAGIAIGYAMKIGTFRREVLLASGSALVAAFSYLSANWIFFWLNLFFALFSGYWMWKLTAQKPKAAIA
ncbi:MAG: hypothetical protein WCS85_04625 [Candidatus Peribacteraceae bacterium]|jgi:hypothetical protein